MDFSKDLASEEEGNLRMQWMERKRKEMAQTRRKERTLHSLTISSHRICNMYLGLLTLKQLVSYLQDC